MRESVPSKQQGIGMQDTLDPQPVASSPRPLRADFSFPPAQVIKRGFQLAMAQLNQLRRTRWTTPPLAPPTAKSPNPHAGRVDVAKRNLDDMAVMSATEQVLQGIQSLENAFASAADTIPADVMLHIRNELAKGVKLVTIPARALENLPLVDPDKAWRD